MAKKKTEPKSTQKQIVKFEIKDFQFSAELTKTREKFSVKHETCGNAGFYNNQY